MGNKSVIAYEGRTTVDKRTIVQGSLYWGELPLPVFQQYDYDFRSADCVGKIVALERVGDTIIATMDIELPSGYVLSLDGEEAVMDHDKNEHSWLIKSMKIVGGTLIPIESWAWKEEQDES